MCTCTCIYICAGIYMYLYMYIHVRMCRCIPVYVYVHVHVYVGVVYVYTRDIAVGSCFDSWRRKGRLYLPTCICIYNVVTQIHVYIDSLESFCEYGFINDNPLPIHIAFPEPPHVLHVFRIYQYLYIHVRCCRWLFSPPNISRAHTHTLTHVGGKGLGSKLRNVIVLVIHVYRPIQGSPNPGVTYTGPSKAALILVLHIQACPRQP